jgi:hypothetical protein
MKTQHPTLDEIIDNYRTHGECTITLKNGQVIRGNFPIPSIKEFGKIIGWDIIPSDKTSPIPVYLDQIEWIERIENAS